MSLPVARSRGPARLGLCNSIMGLRYLLIKYEVKVKLIEIINNPASYGGFEHIVLSPLLDKYYLQKNQQYCDPCPPISVAGGSCDSTFPLCDWPPWPESGSLIGGHESRYSSPNTVQFTVCCLLLAVCSISPDVTGSTFKTVSRQVSSLNFSKAFALVNT